MIRFVCSVAFALLLVGCEWRADYRLCDDNGEGGAVHYTDGYYLTPDGQVYAKAGERPFDDCSVLRGEIILHGEIPHFEDFDSFEEIGGFYDNGYDAPDPPEGWSGGAIRGFPNLRRITQHLYKTSGFLEAGSSDGVFYLDGFESLEYVEGDMSCNGSENVGTELRIVTGDVGCPSARLGKLEHGGYISYQGTPLPNLRTVGSLETSSVQYPGYFELPLLEEVGVGYEGAESEFLGDLILQGNNAAALHVPSLVTVHGRFEVSGFYRADFGSVEEEIRGEFVRAEFDTVDVGGYRVICLNGPDDPCFFQDTCLEIHGEGSALCCDDVWPVCQAQGG